MLEIKILNKVQQQILDQYSYYESLQDGLGDRFETELFDIIDRIETNPYQFPKVDNTFRKAHLKKFPFTVFFFVTDQQVYIVAVWPQAGYEEGWRDF